MASTIDTCNEALAEIAADAIQSLDEGSVEARECKRYYPTVVRDLLEMHDWGIAIRRVRLALLATNERRAEWAYAYAKPPGVASLRRVMPAVDGTFPVVGWWYTPWLNALGALPYVEDAGVIYTNIADAVLEYGAATIEAPEMPALLRRAVVYELASRLAMPIKKDRQIRGDMISLAVNARLVAMADDTNRYPRRDVAYPSEVDLARGGWPAGIPWPAA